MHKNPTIMKKSHLSFALLIILFSSCKDEEIEPVVVTPDSNLKYAEISYIVESNCVGCHSYGGDAAGSGDFSSYSTLKQSLDNSSSEFINRMQSSNEDYRMPPSGDMPSAQIDSLVSWINSGYQQ